MDLQENFEYAKAYNAMCIPDDVENVDEVLKKISAGEYYTSGAYKKGMSFDAWVKSIVKPKKK